MAKKSGPLLCLNLVALSPAGLKKFLKKNADGNTLGVADAKLGNLIKEKLGIPCIYRCSLSSALIPCLYMCETGIQCGRVKQQHSEQAADVLRTVCTAAMECKSLQGECAASLRA